MYKLVSLIPVSVTFCLYIYLFLYYVVFYLHPTISMSYSSVSFDSSWSQNKEELEENRAKAIFYAVLFGFTASNLLIAIIRTISTNPGNIPDHKEWDMSTDTDSGVDVSLGVHDHDHDQGVVQPE